MAPATLIRDRATNSYAGAANNNVTALIGSATRVKADLIFLPYSNISEVSGWQTNSTKMVAVSNGAAAVSLNIANGKDAYAERLHMEAATDAREPCLVP